MQKKGAERVQSGGEILLFLADLDGGFLLPSSDPEQEAAQEVWGWLGRVAGG
jgi:hypothetical protein